MFQAELLFVKSYTLKINVMHIDVGGYHMKRNNVIYHDIVD